MGGPGGRSPHGRGRGGCAPKNLKKGASSPHEQPRYEWGPKRRQTLSPRGWANGGSRGAKPPWQGVWGVSPHETKRGRVVHISNHATSGTQAAGKPSANGGGENGGSRGLAPPGRGLWGVSPHKFKRGRVANPGNHATSGTQNPDEPSANGGGQRGSRGAKPPWRGGWGMCPHKFKRGRAAHPWQPRHEWDPKPWQTLSQRGWGK